MKLGEKRDRNSDPNFFCSSIYFSCQYYPPCLPCLPCPFLKVLRANLGCTPITCISHFAPSKPVCPKFAQPGAVDNRSGQSSQFAQLD